jgi:osmotically-inducible protein OsmY
MSGFVESAEDLHKAVRMADKTAGEKNVINQLTIKEGGTGSG